MAPATLPGMLDCCDIEMRAARALSACRFFPGSWAKTFAYDIYRQAVANKPFTSKQQQWLWKLVWQYRKQIKNEEILQAAITFLGDHDGHMALAKLVEQV